MEKTWRWFGPNDNITLDMLRQIGVEGIVTSLHDVPNGEIWTYEAVKDMCDYIEKYGLHWSVVESLPVSEEIKYASPRRDELIKNYIISLENLGKAGVKTVCYNFMPVLDWARTTLDLPNQNGTTSLCFNMAEFAYFDCKILKRKGAEDSYSVEILENMAKLEVKLQEMSTEEREKQHNRLIENIIIKTQGFVSGNISDDDESPVEKFRALLSLYDGVEEKELRENLVYFLKAIVPTLEKYDIDMCVHPDDPPISVLGLPRIVSCAEDFDWLFEAVPSEKNGLTFCAGSLSSSLRNDVLGLAEKFADRVKFIHLRSTEAQPNGNFRETSHLEGRAHVVDLVRLFMAEEKRSNKNIPMRVDHAPLMLGDEKRGYNAGYSFHGRMFALGQVEGIMATVKKLC